ncbi:MAG: 50S ribosomal protein L24 [Nanohaloarchaea archaeon]|nr:50S ribosomal protein L24 [Candidatus Nanohaloarchaea archaeon]
MVNETENWSSNWKSSKKPSKQRKYRDNAPLHVKDKLVSAHLDEELREEVGTRNMPLRTGDRVRVMRGDQKGAEGIVNNIDRENTRVYIDGVENERTDGSTNQKAFPPSNVQIVALNIEDISRIEKYDVEDYEEIKVEEEELEEALAEDEEENEMMQQMQGGESGAHEQFEEDEEETEEVEEETEETEEEEVEADYSEVVSQNIGDVKDSVQEMESPDYDALLEAEEDNKDRKTMKEWIESQKEE